MSSLVDLVDLASARVGGKALAANDEFFAPKENLLQPGRGLFIPDKFTARGKWMDGWETRRRRTPGHDWCVVRLGMAGQIRGVDVDTNHFVGNFPERASIEACFRPGKVAARALLGPRTAWRVILPPSSLRGGATNLFAIEASQVFTHVRLNIYPDGGVARLRVYGEVGPFVCATGKTTAEMLERLHERLGNDLDTELRVAAGEQAKITRLRLEKRLAS